MLSHLIGLVDNNNNNLNINIDEINRKINQDFYKSALISILFMPFIIEIVFRKILFETLMIDLKQSQFIALIISSIVYGLFYIGYGSSLLQSLIIAIPFIFQGLLLGYFNIKYNHTVLQLLLSRHLLI